MLKNSVPPADLLGVTSSFSDPAAPSAGTVLVVDDEPAVRKSTARLLRRAGLDVLEAGSAAEALALGRDEGQQIDVLLTDVVMPDTNGIELAAEARELWPDAVILLISAFTPTALIRHEIHDGAARGMLQKPLERTELVSTVTRAVEDARERQRRS
jgi:two-component system cell cycle sensor histidine kinase/response regulator CckA